MKHLMIGSLLVVILAVLAACSPSVGQEIPADAPASDASAAQEVSATGTVGALEPVGQIVDVTPMSEAELAAQGPGQTAGGAASDDGEQTEGGDTTAPEALPEADWVIYSDETLGFIVAHPSHFVVRQADAARLAELVPAPSSAFYFVDPDMAERVMAGSDAPDLEVRIFESGPVDSLADWLTSAGVGDDQMQTSVQVGGLSGLEVCGSTMIFPNCSTFVVANERVYQLRALNLEGEAMAQSFTPAP